MSDVMFYGVLRMPCDLAMSDHFSRMQFYDRAQEAANRVEAADKRIAELEQLAAPADLVRRLLDDHQRVEPHHADMCALCKEAQAAIEGQAAQGERQLDTWHQAVIDHCMSVESCYEPTNPRKTISNLIDWHISAERDLGSAQGERDEALEEAARVAERCYAKDAFRFVVGTEAAQQIRALKAQGERHQVPCTSRAATICPQPAYCHANGCKAQGERQPSYCGYCAFPFAQCKCGF